MTPKEFQEHYTIIFYSEFTQHMEMAPIPIIKSATPMYADLQTSISFLQSLNITYQYMSRSFSWVILDSVGGGGGGGRGRSGSQRLVILIYALNGHQKHIYL